MHDATTYVQTLAYEFFVLGTGWQSSTLEIELTSTASYLLPTVQL